MTNCSFSVHVYEENVLNDRLRLNGINRILTRDFKAGIDNVSQLVKGMQNIEQGLLAIKAFSRTNTVV